MRRTYKNRIKRSRNTIKNKYRKTSNKRKFRKGGLGAARQAFRSRFVQGAAQTGKQIVSEVSKDVAGRLTKSTLQDENEGTVSQRTQRIIKRAFNVPPSKVRTPKISTPKLTVPKTSLISPPDQISKSTSKFKLMR